ncbi:HTH-type transcriptional repressor FabR [Aliidiomarina taiwanensis]|uniref:HTH-type transcriptional repressor FabR n=1 Tax=Aliidiomarina taiwanensis TaxID=946228 RepID=A0A432X7G3_9GAMM|nr:HTH-type transcriptional repressor FabR [Aliidiomarina taiwanensis]RUO42756.1 HTH-type transcriptional repressor FabR [Aliidiomarina taiwanensis]
MSGVRAQQKERTRHALIQAALNQLCAESSFSSLSLREVSREAGIAPTSFYRHFENMNELGLTLVDEGGLALRQLMRQSRQRIAKGGSIIEVSVRTFMDYVTHNKNIFRLMLQEQAGTTVELRLAIAREISHFTNELRDFLIIERNTPDVIAQAQSNAIVRVVFSAGADALDLNAQELEQLTEQTILQVRMIAHGALSLQKQEESTLTSPPAFDS